MADLALSALQTLFAALQCKQLQNFCVGYKSQLEDLEETVLAVENVLIDAELRDGQLSPQEKHYIEKLKNAVYDADDLFDEVLTLSELEKYETGDILPVNPLDKRGRSEIMSTSGGEELLTSDNSMELATVSGRLHNTPELRFDEDAQPWRSLNHTLRDLILQYARKVVSLPKGLQYLTNLEYLTIEDWENLENIAEWIGSLSSLTYLSITDCPKIKSLPSEMSKLTSLHRLVIRGCSEELYQRCQEDPQGDDWLNICHVPHLHIS